MLKRESMKLNWKSSGEWGTKNITILGLGWVQDFREGV